MKRYVANADGTTMTMFTGMMHTDMTSWPAPSTPTASAPSTA